MPEDATRDFGAFLRDARERAGISLRTIATNTKISMPSLEALERNDVARLPGGIFLRSFVRAYAKEVGLDPDDAIRRFAARFPDAAAVEDPSAHEPTQSRTAFGDEAATGRVWRLVGWSLPLVLVIVYFGFGGRLAWLRDQLKPSTPKAAQQAEQTPAAPETPVLTTPAGASVEPAAGSPAASTAVGASNPAGNPADAARTATPPAPRPSDTITAPATEGRFSLTLAPRGRCWVTVRSNGKIIFAGTMTPGDRQNLVLGGNVSLTVGDAAAMTMEIDGKPAKPLGAAGQVRTLLMNAQNLQDFLEVR